MLRRRPAKNDVPPASSSRDDRSFRRQSEGEKLRAEFDDAKVKHVVIQPRSKRRNGLIFVLGGLFGIFIALFFANQQEVISLESLMDLNLESLFDAIPQGIVRDAKEFSVCSSLRLLLLSCNLAYGWHNYSNTNAMLSVTTHFLSDYTFNPKVFRPNTPSS